MKFLIPTEPDDTHALLTKLALETMDYHVRLFFMADHPTLQKNSIFIDTSRYQWKSSDHYESILDNDYDVVWYRRVRKPHVPKLLTHPEDYTFVVRENNLFHDSLTYNMAPDAWWVNPKESSRRASSKLLQLKLAIACGMKVPITLCSNDPLDIRYFISQHCAEGVIYKPICSHFWFEEKELKIAYTAKVNEINLPTNRALALTPGLYQKEVRKKYELRIICFGDELVAVKIDSQAHPEGQVDWRAIPEGQMDVESVPLPDLLTTQIRAFMRQLGIVFGSFDFIVTPDDQYIFLEVNEQGQFLWLEELNPDIKMLDRFIQFLLNKSRDFHWNEKACLHTIEKYRHYIEPLYNENRRRHIDLNNVKKHQLHREG